MTLRDQFEKETREELPLLKNYEYDHEGYYSDTANYFTEYSKWLETKLQNTRKKKGERVILCVTNHWQH